MLRLGNITKDFPGVRAVDGVDLELGRGEVLGLVGENGAGKSTLIKILAGVHPAGSFTGEITLESAPRAFHGPADARAAGIAVVHQELSLIPEMSVADNLVLGDEPTRFGLVDHVAVLLRAEKLLARFGAELDLEAPVSALGVGVQQILEIARALGANARVVVLDEPTAALTDREAARLFEVVETARARGTSFIYISHRLEEIFRLCDRVQVLRDGRHVAAAPTTDTDADEVVAWMTGKELAELEVEHTSELGDTVLQIEHLSMDHPTVPGKKVLDDVSLHLRAGEVVTLAGAMGSGRSALLATLFGLGRGRTTGRVAVDGREARLDSPREAILGGLAYVPEDRKEQGLVLGMSVADNILLASLPAYVDSVACDRRAAAQADALAIKTAGVDVPVATLSGGNQQKVVLGKWLLTEPALLLLDEPTRGVDVGAKAEIYRVIRQLTDRGMAVLVASSDLPEVLLLSDRILVMREGRLAGSLTRPEASQERIMKLAVGVAA